MDQFDPHRLRRRIGKAVCYAGSIAFIQSQRRHRVRASHAQGMSQSASILEWIMDLFCWWTTEHYCDVIMGVIVSQITSLAIVYSTVYSDADQRKHQSSASLAFVRGIHRGPVNSQHKRPVTRKMFAFDDVIMKQNFCKQLNMKSVMCSL